MVAFVVELIAKERKCEENLAPYKTLPRLLPREGADSIRWPDTSPAWI